MKKGQSQTYIFMLILVLVFAFLIAMFFMVISKKIFNTNEVFSSTTFISDFKGKLSGIAYGERREISFSVPGSVKRICFFDREPLPAGNPLSEEDYSAYYKARFNNTVENVAFERGSNDVATDELPNLRVYGQYMKCFKVNGFLYLFVEGIGAGQFTVKEE
jgi:hypothetical protein